MVSFDMNFHEALRAVENNGAEKTAADWLMRVEEEFGSAPLIYRKLEASPEALISHLLYKNAVTAAGALPPKTVELISLAVGAALRCDHCTSYHMHAAQKVGATREEILETVLLAGMLSQSSILANAYRVVEPITEKKECGVSCAVQKVV
ncbi:MAG TPA: carboxymuconolactone decarboxylase family protein [Methanocorpusculum sp.]|nr:carboxymuconolactone decarboxylase family protein [Methanocorpusculum sp.]